MMRKRIDFIVILLLMIGGACAASAQKNLRAFAIFDKSGKEVSFQTMVNALAKKQIVFFGEMHNCPVNHWLEYKVLEALYKIHSKGLVLGAEMFECDNQLIMNEYLDRLISEKSFETEMRLWDNYSTDYVKLVDFAFDNHLPFVATNVPRRYAQMVSDKGLKVLDSLNLQEKQLLAPLPIAYKEDTDKVNMFGAMSGIMGHRKNGSYMAQAQALKDATMAWNIAQAFKNGAQHFIHFNGSFHSDMYGGIIPYLHLYAPQLSVATITACKQEDIDKLGEESVGRADFIICIPEDMTTSY